MIFFFFLYKEKKDPINSFTRLSWPWIIAMSSPGIEKNVRRVSSCNRKREEARKKKRKKKKMNKK